MGKKASSLKKLRGKAKVLINSRQASIGPGPCHSPGLDAEKELAEPRVGPPLGKHLKGDPRNREKETS